MVLDPSVVVPAVVAIFAVYDSSVPAVAVLDISVPVDLFQSLRNCIVHLAPFPLQYNVTARILVRSGLSSG